MKRLFAAFLVIHGFIHLMGTAKGFCLAAIPQLTQPISGPAGVLWLLAAVLMLATDRHGVQRQRPRTIRRSRRWSFSRRSLRTMPWWGQTPTDTVPVDGDVACGEPSISL